MYKNFTENFNFKDKLRNRRIAVSIYFNQDIKRERKIPVVFFSHGGVSSNTEYSYIATSLAEQGYAVICIQHNFIGDQPHSLKKFNTGILKNTRKPIWELWSGNILFVIKAMKSLKPSFDLERFTVAGHSTGGDVSMFFAAQYPKMVSNIISLDGRRCPFPRNAKCRVLLLQANDTTTEDGVIPDASEKHKLLDVQIIKVKDAVHADYSDEGREKIQKEVIKIVIDFLCSSEKLFSNISK
jgi:predicted dienelactone hydrolase